MLDEENERYKAEEAFHDDWAKNADYSSIDVIKMNESITAPEMQQIVKFIGSLKGKSLLDVGCGLGEASAYFALKGANVTSTDISGGMLEIAQKLAARNNVQLKTHKSTAEDLDFRNGEKFDVVYVGNLFHHVEIEPTILNIKKVMNPNAILVSWDPLAYNPLINIYRWIAKDVRTEDEHPFKLSDINLFKKHFNKVTVQYYWLTTLIIFILMVLVQFRNPNKVRFWKIIVEEGDKWSWLYRPLAALDSFLLRVFPFLGLLCWNVVIKAEEPKE